MKHENCIPILQSNINCKNTYSNVDSLTCAIIKLMFQNTSKYWRIDLVYFQ